MCFAVTFANFLRTPFLANTSGDCFHNTKINNLTATEEQLFCGKAFLRRPSIFMELCFRRTCISIRRECSIKKVLLQNLQKSQENTYARALFTVVNFAKFLRATFFANTSGWLLQVMCNGHL